MSDIFTKYYFDEEDVLLYYHHQDSWAVRQIMVFKDKTIFLSEENPIQGESFLSDAKFEDLEVSEDQFITKEEFEKAWKKKSK